MEKLYCTIFVVDVSQNPEEVETVSSRIQQLIEDHGGIIKKVNPWGKQKLAYPIQKRNYGYYVEIEFTANSHLNIPKIIEQEYRINDRVLRYLTYVVTKKELQQRSINAARMTESPAEAQKEERKVSAPVSEDDDYEGEGSQQSQEAVSESPDAQEEAPVEEISDNQEEKSSERSEESQEPQEPQESEQAEEKKESKEE